MNNIHPEDAQKIIEREGAVVIDVRTPEEFIQGHIQGAKNINFNDASFTEKVGMFNKDANYIVNCQSGGRSSRATSLMRELGFKNVSNLEGGIIAWKNAGLLV